MQLGDSCYPPGERDVLIHPNCVLSSDLQAALKKYQTEQRSKGDALDKCQAELKKLRKKSQGSKNPQKYSDKELQVGLGRTAAYRTGVLAGGARGGWQLWSGCGTGACLSVPLGSARSDSQPLKAHS